MILQQMGMVHKILCYDLLHVHEVLKTLQKSLQMFWFSFCIGKCNSKVIFKTRSTILTIKILKLSFLDISTIIFVEIFSIFGIDQA